MADKKAPDELDEGDLAAVQGGASDAPVAASRFGISIDGVQSSGSSQLLGHELTHVQQQGDGEKQDETSSKIVASGGSSGI